MNIGYNQPKPPNSNDASPWHPETLMDIRGVNTFDLPRTSNVGAVVNSQPSIHNWMPTDRMVSGSESFVREWMEDIFTHNPAVGFMVSDEGVVHVFEYQAQELEVKV